MNPLQELAGLGQSVWLDFIRRGMLGAELGLLIEQDCITGITSNPALFETAIAHSDEYDAQLAALSERGAFSAEELCEELALADIQRAADQLCPVYERTAGADGFVSMEVAPRLADDTAGTVADARRLWRRLERPNVMIKVPGTPAGIPAIEQLVGEGINVNVTLLFGQAAYQAAAHAFLRGLERYGAAASDLSRVASVASLFVSRVDTAVDAALDARIAAGGDPVALGALKGRAAIANARIAHRWFEELCAGERWRRLAARGARPQRLLWASTGVKNPAYRDVLYVEELAGAGTVTTLPPATLAAFRSHGTAEARLRRGAVEAQAMLDDLERAGIALPAIADRLLADGVRLFQEAADRLLVAVKGKAQALSRVP